MDKDQDVKDQETKELPPFTMWHGFFLTIFVIQATRHAVKTMTREKAIRGIAQLMYGPPEEEPKTAIGRLARGIAARHM